MKLNESGSTLLKGHYGRYYRGIVTGEFDNTTPSIAPRYLFSGNYDAAGNPLDLELVSDTSQLAVDPNLKNPYTDQFIVAVEQQVGPDIGFSVNYVHKESKRQTAFPDVGGTYDLVNYLCGFLRISYWPFLLATILGSIPGTIAFVFLGATLTPEEITNLFLTGELPRLDWRLLLISVAMFVVSIALSRYFRRREQSDEPVAETA